MFNSLLCFDITVLLFYTCHIQESIISLLKKEYRSIQSNYKRSAKSIVRESIFKVILCLTGLAISLTDFTTYLKPLILLILLILHLNYFKFFKSIIDISDRHLGMINIGLIISCFYLDLGLYFIAINTLLVYFFTGYHKLKSRTWRSGEALSLIMNTKTYGNHKLFTFLDSYKYLSIIFSWFIICFQIFFLLAILNLKMTIVLLVLGFFFHLFNLLIMRLYTFFLSFVMCYPSIIVFSNFINSL